VEAWGTNAESHGIHVIVASGSQCRGCGFAKNRAVEQSHGEYLCFQDADDVMMPERIVRQLGVATQHRSAIIGTMVERFAHLKSLTKRHQDTGGGYSALHAVVE